MRLTTSPMSMGDQITNSMGPNSYGGFQWPGSWPGMGPTNQQQSRPQTQQLSPGGYSQSPGGYPAALGSFAFQGMGTAPNTYRGRMASGLAGGQYGLLPGGMNYMSQQGPGGGLGPRFSPINQSPAALGLRESALLGIPNQDLPSTLFRMSQIEPQIEDAWSQYRINNQIPSSQYTWDFLTSPEQFGRYPIWGTQNPFSWQMAALGNQLRSSLTPAPIIYTPQQIRESVAQTGRYPGIAAAPQNPWSGLVGRR